MGSALAGPALTTARLPNINVANAVARSLFFISYPQIRRWAGCPPTSSRLRSRPHMTSNDLTTQINEEISSVTDRRPDIRHIEWCGPAALAEQRSPNPTEHHATSPSTSSTRRSVAPAVAQSTAQRAPDPAWCLVPHTASSGGRVDPLGTQFRGEQRDGNLFRVADAVLNGLRVIGFPVVLWDVVVRWWRGRVRD